MAPEPIVQITSTARLRLRELTYDDAAFVQELVNDPDWIKYIGDRNVHSVEAARGYVDKIRTGYDKYGFGLWAVEPLEGGATLGLAGLIKRDTLEHADVGFAFLPDARGKGYARESVTGVLVLAHTRFGLGHVLAITDPENSASQRVLETVGFKFERFFADPADQTTLSLYARDLP
jgi:RimJ/RimL family protein N-acetyltransferase